MPTRTSRAEHDAAVARRLRLLGEELASVRGPADEPVPPPRLPTPSPGPAPVTVPVPGRHAARRARAPLLPETLRGRVRIGAGPLAVVAVLVAIGLGVTAWWVIRAQPASVTPVAPASAPALAAPASPVAEASPSATATGGSVTVDVAGRVRRPGIVVLDAGARVVDALEAAGGARPGVDLSSLNLARLLVDGEQVVVGVPPAATGLPASTAPGGTSTVAPVGTLVDLNTADQVALESLPEVGPVTALAIIAWREENGGFTAIAELLEVDGIGDATLAAMEPFVTV